jgi:TolB-like protein/Tfp pilus assembly protein PilF
MSDIFIGYARKDREHIEKLAAAIEAAGHSVWWDQRVIGGSEFSKDIERELEAAKAVVIAWSGHSSESPWVKDEAAVGRDQGKLVPVTLDSELPPMGFRQYQAVDFSGWNGKADHPAVADLLRAVEARISGVKPAQADAGYPPMAGQPNRKRLVAAAAALIGILAVFAAFQFRGDDNGGKDVSKLGTQGDPAATTALASSAEPQIAVAPIKVREVDPAIENLAASLGEDIANGLARFSYLRVASRLPDPGQAGYVLEGTLRHAGPTLRLTTTLVELSSGRQVWGESFDRAFDEQNILDIQDDLTDHVVASVADPYGALMRDLSRAVALKPPEQMTAYETILRHFIYRQRLSADDHLETRKALEHGVELAPGDADVWASLAAIYSEEYKHDYNPLSAPLDRALKAARKAVELEPDNAYANFALAEVYFFSQDLGAFRAAAERAIALNPRDSDAMAMIGIMMGYGGDWERSVELTTRAMTLNPNHPGWYRFNTFFNEYRQEHYEAALSIAQRINVPDYFADPYVRAMTHAQLGNEEQAARALNEFRALWPGATLEELRTEHLHKWFYAQPELIELVIDGLRKAGLEEGGS